MLEPQDTHRINQIAAQPVAAEVTTWLEDEDAELILVLEKGQQLLSCFGDGEVRLALVEDDARLDAMCEPPSEVIAHQRGRLFVQEGSEPLAIDPLGLTHGH